MEVIDINEIGDVKQIVAYEGRYPGANTVEISLGDYNMQDVLNKQTAMLNNMKADIAYLSGISYNGSATDAIIEYNKDNNPNTTSRIASLIEELDKVDYKPLAGATPSKCDAKYQFSNSADPLDIVKAYITAFQAGSLNTSDLAQLTAMLAKKASTPSDLFEDLAFDLSYYMQYMNVINMIVEDVLTNATWGVDQTPIWDERVAKRFPDNKKVYEASKACYPVPKNYLYTTILKAIFEAQANGLDVAYVLALFFMESGFHPHAISTAYAVGIGQFMPATAKDCGLTISSECDERFNFIRNTEGCCQYIAKLYKKHKTWFKTLKAYTGFWNHSDSEFQNTVFNFINKRVNKVKGGIPA